MDVLVAGEEARSAVAPARGKKRAVITWLLIVPFAAWVILRLTGYEMGDRLIQLMSFTPYIAAGSAVPALIAVLARQKTASVVALAVVVAFGVLVLPRAFGSPDPASGGTRLRLLSTNMFFGYADVDAIVRLARKADVVSVQELTPSGVTALDDAGMKDLMPYRVLEVAHGPKGTGLYSRYPVKQLESDYVGFNMPQARVSLPAAAVEIVAIHTRAPTGGAWREWRDGLRSLPTPGDTPTVLAGDFNATLDHAGLRELIGRGYRDAADVVGKGLSMTWPSGRRPSVVAIDHVLADKRFSISALTVHEINRTDHRALLADLRLPPGA